MHSNELTFNELSAFDFLPNDWGQIDIAGYSEYQDDEEVCFKLAVWSLQCKFGTMVMKYVNHLFYGAATQCMLSDALTFKRGLEVLNNYDPRDIALEDTIHNVLPYSTILNILQILHNKY